MMIMNYAIFLYGVSLEGVLEGQNARDDHEKDGKNTSDRKYFNPKR